MEPGAAFQDAPSSAPGPVAGLVLHGRESEHRVIVARDDS